MPLVEAHRCIYSNLRESWEGDVAKGRHQFRAGKVAGLYTQLGSSGLTPPPLIPASTSPSNQKRIEAPVPEPAGTGKDEYAKNGGILPFHGGPPASMHPPLGPALKAKTRVRVP